MLTVIKTFLIGAFTFFLLFSFGAFAVMNRQDVLLIWNPADAPLELPFYLVAFAFFGGGFLLGAIVVWGHHISAAIARFIPARRQDKFKKALQESGLS